MSKACYESHPEITLSFSNGKTGILNGGNCATPHTDADVFISLDKHAAVYDFEQPWNTNPQNKQHVRFLIEDFCVPDSLDETNKLAQYALEKLAEGKKLYVGCLGGHGRTGTILSVIVQKYAEQNPTTPEGKNIINSDNAIDYVREKYCHHAVETLSQHLFLNHFYNIKLPQNVTAVYNHVSQEFSNKTNMSIKDALKSHPHDKVFGVVDDIENEYIKTLKKKIKF